MRTQVVGAGICDVGVAVSSEDWTMSADVRERSGVARVVATDRQLAVLRAELAVPVDRVGSLGV